MRKKLSKYGTLAAAVCWSVTTALWMLVTVLRFCGKHADVGLAVLTLFALLANGAACIAWWYRYANYEES